MARNPCVAGSFYPAEKTALLESVKACFLSKNGPEQLPKLSGAGKKGILGLISPHAGYSYSGSCAAFGYKALTEAEKPDVVVIIGLSHSGFPSCASEQDWKTPLGTAKVDRDFVDSIGLPVMEDAHEQEHSIEVQLPFLQFVLGKDLKFVPIIANTDLHYSEIAEMLRRAIVESRKKVFLIASSDFTHYGKSYGFTPFSTDVKKQLRALDAGAIEFIKKLDARGFVEYASEKTTICGIQPIAVLLETLKLLGAKKADLLKYCTSGDVSGDYSTAVGYASIAVY